MQVNSHSLPNIQTVGAPKGDIGQKSGLAKQEQSAVAVQNHAEKTAPNNPVTPRPLVSTDTLLSVIEQGQDEKNHGKSANSPAHQARQAIADNPQLATLPFGKVVSLISRDLALPEVLVTPETQETAEGIPTEAIMLEAEEQSLVTGGYVSELEDESAPADTI